MEAQRVPPQVAQQVNEFVGQNDLRNGDELKKITQEAQEKLWEEFFDKELKPTAEKGTSNHRFDVEKHFPGMSRENLQSLLARKKVKVVKNDALFEQIGPAGLWVTIAW